ncbi:hypothetical protein FS749_009955 [Ceratobasidium sp. UAMH 11750]|nr:hypothetical protein FS749_009955 [Ceratobasidium sp. UAMH 11750]
MAGAIDLLLYGIAVFISPVAVYFKKGVGVQFWVNCCLYCLMGVPGMLPAFYIIHTNKYDKKARRQTPQSSQSPETQQRYSHLPSLPHPDRYRPPASYSPYEDHPPPVPPKREDTLPYDLALHPNASGTNIGRAKAVLHTYQIPESTLHPPPISSRPRRRVPSPEPPRPDPEPEPAPESAPEPTPEPEPEAPSRPQPQLQTQSEPPPAAPPLDPNDPNAPLPYPAEYHPNASGQNVAKAKAVLHTYQIPEITFPAPESEPLLPAAEQDKPNQLHPATGLKSKSMWSLRRRGKGLSTLDVNSPTAIPSPGSLSPRPKWQAGPSWIRRLRRPEQVNPATTDEDDGPSTMVMVWDDKIAEFGLGRGGDAYSAGSRALRSGSRDHRDRERRTSLGTLPSPFRSPNRLSFGTATSDTFGGTGSSTVPVIRRGLTQGTFGTGITSTTATSEEGPIAGKTSPGGENPKNEDDVQDEEELSQDEQVERWIKREDERRSQSESQPPTSHGHSSLRVNSPCGPDEASIFSEESSGFAGIGVASAQEKGRAGRIELWDRPDWNGSNPSASPEGSAQQQHARYHDEDPFRNPPPSTAAHPPHATGQQSPQVPPLSPPTSPRASHPTLSPPSPVPAETLVPVKPAPLRMDTFGVGERPSFGLLSPPATERVKGKGKERAISPPPPVPVRPRATQAPPQSPQLPLKPAILRSMSGGDEDDLSAVYIRALRDEL